MLFRAAGPEVATDLWWPNEVYYCAMKSLVASEERSWERPVTHVIEEQMISMAPSCEDTICVFSDKGHKYILAHRAKGGLLISPSYVF